MLTLLVAYAVFSFFRQDHGYWMAAILSIPVLGGLTVLFFAIYMGSAVRIIWLRRAISVLKGTPADLPLECRRVKDEKVPALYAVGLGTDGDERSAVVFKQTLLHWRRGTRTVRQVLKSGRQQRVVAIILFGVVTLPATVFFLWVGLTQHWVGFALFAMVPFAQFFIPLFIPQVLAEVLEGWMGQV